MTELAGFRTYLRDEIGVLDVTGVNAAGKREAIQSEGLNVIDDLVDFDDDEIKILCQSVRKPGGTVQDPNDPTRTIPDPGFKVPAICEKRLKLAANGARIYRMINRPITQASLDRNRLKLFDQHLRLIEDHSEPEQIPQVSKTFGIMRAMDLIPSHLRERLGSRKIPLSYIIRETEIPPTLGPLVDENRNTRTPCKIHSQEYQSIMEQLIEHAELSGSEFEEDNVKVFHILHEIVNNTSFESSIKSFQIKRDGRSAYLALFQHNMGSSKWD